MAQFLNMFFPSNFHLQNCFPCLQNIHTHPPRFIQKTVPIWFGIIHITHTYERMVSVIICDSVCSLKKGPSNYQVSKFIFPVAFKCCSFKCLFEGKNFIPSLREEYHTVRFTSKQLNTFPSIVFKVFRSLYFSSSLNKAASLKSECLKLGF